MSHPQLWKGWNVVWDEPCDIFHLADLRRGFFPNESQTLCGLLVLLPVISEANVERQLKDGLHNCAKCFKDVKELK